MRIIVTGASGALGRSVVGRFAAVGASIACFGRNKGSENDRLAWFVTPDLAIRDEAELQVSRAAQWLGGVDALVHLAGAFEWKPVEESTLNNWRALFTANVETAVNAVQAVLPHMARDAAIVMVGAASAQSAQAGMAPYGTAKSGVARLVEALSHELRPKRIRVNAVLPAIIDTPRNRADMPDADFASWTSPDAIADAIYFLASSASRSVNGAFLETTNGS